jgi:hypothetical protein
MPSCKNLKTMSAKIKCIENKTKRNGSKRLLPKSLAKRAIALVRKSYSKKSKK